MKIKKLLWIILGFFVMMRKDLYIPCVILGGVWLFHVIYFVFGVQTLKENSYAS